MSEVETPRNPSVICSNVNIHRQAASSTMHGSDKYKRQHGTVVEPRNSCGFSSSHHIGQEMEQMHMELGWNVISTEEIFLNGKILLMPTQ